MIIVLENDLIKDLFQIYDEKGKPLGKNRRGRKKWVKRYIIKNVILKANKVLSAAT